jgi:hypothetical protein
MEEHIDNRTAELEPMTLPDVVRVVFSGPVAFVSFARTYLTRQGPPAFYLAAWLLGMDGVAGALELEFLTTGTHIVDNWFHAWLRIVFAGVAAGVVRYWLVGTLFHGVVLLSGGRGSARTSRYVFLYAALPVVVVELTVKVVQMLVYGNGYFAGLTNPSFDGAAGGVMMGSFVYTAVLCYAGMRGLMSAPRTRSLLVIGFLVVLLVWFALAFFFRGGA